jgi:hypothetical protein
MDYLIYEYIVSKWVVYKSVSSENEKPSDSKFELFIPKRCLHDTQSKSIN